MSDTPDFFRRPHQYYPQHGHRFTGEPAYFKHTYYAAQHLMEELGYAPQDYAMVIFHQPNSKFPRRVAQRLGFTEEQLKPGFLVEVIGNAYAGSSPLGFAAALDEARPGDRILLVSFGSGAGSDALSFTATERILKNDDSLVRARDYIARRQEIDYGTYCRYRDNLNSH